MMSVIKKSYFGVEENREVFFTRLTINWHLDFKDLMCHNKKDLPYRNTVTFQVFSSWSLLTKLPVIHFLTVSCLSKFMDEELLTAFRRQSLSLIGSLPLSIHPTASLWGVSEAPGHLGDKVSRIFRIWSGLGIGGHRVYTCQQRCQPSSACRKYNMIGAWPNIGMFSHRGCCLGRMSRRLLMTLVCCQLCLRELKNGFVRWSIRTKMEEAEKRISEKKCGLALPCSNQYPAISHWEEKNPVTDNLSFSDCLTMNY